MKILLFLLLFSSTSKADVWTGTIRASQEYACLGIDGVPIGNSSPMAATCCNSDHYLIENAPDTCHAGFQTITTDAGTGAAIGVNLANTSLTTASEIGSDSLDTSESHPSLTGNSGVRGESIASVAGTEGFTSGGSLGSAHGNGHSSVASPGGGSGAAGAGSGLSVGSSGGTSGLKAEGEDPNSQKANGGGYAKNGDGGKVGANGNNGLFGGLGGANAASGVGSDAKITDLQMGEEGDGLAGANATGEDPDGRGSAEDPSDYFNRIDKTADIFKVVSARYLKKKSLWLVPQKKI